MNATIFVAKMDFEAHSQRGPTTISKGMVFMVNCPKELPHPLGKDPERDDDPMTESDKWASSGDWKNQYSEYKGAFNRVE